MKISAWIDYTAIPLKTIVEKLFGRMLLILAKYTNTLKIYDYGQIYKLSLI